MSNFPSVLPTLNLQFANQKTPEDMLSHLNSVGATFDRGSESTALATYVDHLGNIRTAPANYPRPYFDPATKDALGILIEGGRTNQIDTSVLTSWTLISGDISVSSYGAYRGITFYKLEKTGPTAYAGLARTVGTLDAGEEAVVSFLVSDIDYGGTVYIYSRDSIDGDPQNAGVKFNLSNQSTTDLNTGSNISLEATGYEDWGEGLYRVWYRLKNNYGSTRTIYHTIRFESSSSGFSFIAAAPQFEVGNSMSSIILTSGSAITRSPDTCYIDGQDFSDFYNQKEGTFLSEFLIPQTLSDSVFRRVIDLHNDSNNWYSLQHHNNTLRLYNKLSGTTTQVGSNITNSVAGQVHKYAFYYDNGASNINSYFNGSASQTSSQNVNENIQKFWIGSTWLNSSRIDGYLQRIIYFPSALSDTDLQRLSYDA